MKARAMLTQARGRERVFAGRRKVYSILSEEGVESHHGDTEVARSNSRFQISNLRFQILKSPCPLRVLRASVVNPSCSTLKHEETLGGVGGVGRVGMLDGLKSLALDGMVERGASAA
jgi:hypothetical protein